MTSPIRSHKTRVARLFVSWLPGLVAILFGFGLANGAAYAVTATTTTLAISASNVPYKTPITLTATITAGGSPVSSGLVLFCDATATYCENNSTLLARVQVTTAGMAVVKIGSGPLGIHSYKAVYRANNSYASSTSNTVSYTVQGTYASSTVIASSGTVGNYTLGSTVSGVGANTSPGPSGSVSFIDTSAGNNVLGTEPLGTPTLTNTFSQAPNSPFAIGDGLSVLRSLVVASSYLDGDNNLDTVTGDADQVITVLLGNGDGTFKPKVNYPGCPSLSTNTDVALKILLADFNRDGNTDIALGCSDKSNGGVGILLGNGDGTFQPVIWNATGNLSGVAMGDFNGDGILDLAVANSSQQTVQILIGNGDGTFQAPVTVINTPKAIGDIVVADFNGDGKDDLAYAVGTAVPASTLSDLYVALGKGNGTFKSPTRQASQIGEFLATGDTNSDNIPDIVSSTITLQGAPSTRYITNSMFVLIGNGDGTLQTPVSYVSDIPSDPHLADVNGDGKADIIAGGSYGALVYLGNGDGTFQPYNEPVIGNFTLTYAVNAGDFNNDGNADLIGTDANSPRAAVALSDVKQASDANALTGVAVFPLGSGVHNVDASYSGDSIYLTSVSSTVPLLAAPTPTTLTLNASPAAEAAAGQQVTLTATLSPYTVGPPTTTTDGETVNFYSGSTLVGNGTLGNGVATLVTTSLPAGTNALKAVYPGDTNYNTSSSSSVSFNVSSVTVTTNPNPSSYAQVVTLTATVASGSTGTVTFQDGSTALGTAAISGTTASITTSTLSVGSHSITAVYNGDSTHVAAISSAVTQVVNKLNPTVSVTTLGQSTYLSLVTITATVPSDATGTVVFVAGTTTLGTATVSGGSASITTTALPVGNNVITANYSGDGNYNAGSASTTRAVTKASPSSALTSSANPSTYGSNVIFTDTLPSSATGTVTFTAGPTVLGTVALVNGVASISTANLAIGNTTITATYNGDGNNNTSVASLVQAVVKATPNLVLASSSNPSTVGQSVTLTATLPAASTGTVSFMNGVTVLGTTTISNGVATVTTSTLPTGTDTITAQYAGDTNYNGTSSTLDQVVNKLTPTVTVTTSGPSIYGNPVTISASVSGSATGTVTFMNGGTALGTATISGGAATISVSTLSAGSDTITANYGGDTNNNTASGTVVQVVSKATPTSTLTSSINPSVYGNPVTFTDTLPTAVTGTVTFTNGATVLGSSAVNGGVATLSTTSLVVGTSIITATYNGDSNYTAATSTLNQIVGKNTPTLSVSTSGPSIYGASVTITAALPTGVTGTVSFVSGVTSLGSAPINASGIATITTTVLPVGTDTITATYAGDSNNNGATGATTQIVSRSATTISVTTSGPSTYGSLVTITATVPSTGTGTVAFTSGGTSLGTATVTNGTAVVTTTILPVGTDTITAAYGGDSNYNPASATTTQAVSKVTPTLNLVSSLNPAAYGQSVTFTATLPATVTGSVTFSNGLGTIAVSNGIASVTTSTLPAGSTTITANYSGDTTNNAATGSLVETINQNATTVTVTTSGPSIYGNPVTITATVPSAATGTITFASGVLQLGIVTVSGGTAVVTTSNLPVGDDTITASYSGDSNYSAGVGSTIQIVSKITPTVTVTTSGPSTYGNPVTITTSVPPGTTGTVTVSSGGTVIGVVPVNPSTGTGTITTTNLPVGIDTIISSYSGDTNNNPATGTTTQTVGKLTPVLPPPGVSSSNPPPNTPVTITEQVPSGVTGSVTFSNGSTVLGTAPIVGGVATITVPSLPVGSNPITASVPETPTYNAATSPATVVTVSKITPVVTLISSINPASTGQSIVFTASVPSGATGAITFMDGGVSLGVVGVSNGQASITSNTLTAGTHLITAVYGGDQSYNDATSTPLAQVVGKGTPNLPPPVVSNPTQTYGGTETITETVPPGVSGPVTFYNGGNPIGTAPIVNGTATITVSNLPVGSNPITASTPGDANNNPATSPATIVTIVKITPVLPAPGVSNATPGPNTPVTITEQVPSGVSGPITFSNGSTILGTATVVNGVATLTVPSLPLGVNPITASVAATATSNAATSPATNVTVGLTTAAVVLSSSANPAAINQAITFTASVPTGATGTIIFHDGATVLGSGSISAAGIATWTTSSLAVGTHPITASYNGDSNYNPAVSAVLSQVIGKLPTTITLSTNNGTTLLNGAVTLTAVVSSTAPTPTGSVTFLDGTTVLGSIALSTNGGVVGFQLTGNAALSLSTLTSGSHTITAVYSGDSMFLTSTSNPVAELVHDFTNKNTGAASASLFPGDSASYKFTLAPIGTTTFPNAVNLTISGLPEGTSYTFSPVSVGSGSGSTDVTLNLTTSKSLRASNRIPTHPGSHDSSIALGMLGIVSLGAARRYRRKMPRMLLVLLLLAGSLLPVASLTGCTGGGYFELSPTTYTVTVTGTEGTIQHSATATLVVQ